MSKQTKKSMILIVEDEISLLNALHDKLELEDYVVLTATNGLEGLETVPSKKPDLILLDILMPKMNGVEMLKKLREDTWGKTVPVLVFTNDVDAEHMKESLKENAVDYLVKSDWSIKDVMNKVRSILKAQ